jgi:hypothetical protein
MGTLKRLLRHRAFVIGAVLFGAMVLMAVLAPLLGVAIPTKWLYALGFNPLPCSTCWEQTTWAALY